MTAVLTLVLGIGGISAIFSVVNSVLLRPLAGVDTERIVRISEDSPRRSGGARPRTYREWRQLTDIFEQIAAIQECDPNLTGLGEAEQVYAPCVSSPYFAVYEAGALLGRTFLPDEERAVVLDYSFWISHFGGDRGVIGRSLTLDEKPYTIIGVMPAEFRPYGKNHTDLYMPWLPDQNENVGITVVGRLRRGGSIRAASEALNVIERRLARATPQDYAGLTPRVVPMIEVRVGQYRELLRLLLGAAGLMLLVACVNTANLFLARGIARRRETEIRAALGANRRQLLAPALAESAIVSFLGGGLGLLAAWGTARLLALRLQNFPRAEEIHVDSRVALVTLGLAVLTAFAGGSIAPRFSIKSSRRGGLVIAELALTFVLLICSGLLIRSFISMNKVDLGYDSRGVISGFVSQPEDLHDQRERAVALRQRVRERLTRSPGVAAVAMTTSMPPGGVGIDTYIVRDGEDPGKTPPAGEKRAYVVTSSGEYFHVAGIRLRSGRTFTERDNASAPRVAIVSQSIADRYFGGNALGHYILYPELDYNARSAGAFTAHEIVGVVSDIKQKSVSETGVMTMYLPEAQAAVRFTYIVIRAASADPMRLERAMRHAVFEESPELAVSPVHSLESESSYLTDTPRRAMWLLGLFAAVALALASVGVHGIVAYTTARRSREMGIRMALGARPEQLFGLVTRQALRLAITGAAMGGVLAYLCAGLLRALLFGVERSDPATYGAAALILLAVAALASITPALRAARTDPAVALRAE